MVEERKRSRKRGTKRGSVVERKKVLALLGGDCQGKAGEDSSAPRVGRPGKGTM